MLKLEKSYNLDDSSVINIGMEAMQEEYKNRWKKRKD